MSNSFLTLKISRSFLIITGLVAILLIGVTIWFSRQNNSGVQQHSRIKVAQKAIAGYVDNAVLKTIELLVADAEQLNRSAQDLQTERSAEHLDALVSAWHTSYGAWKQTAAFLYGPAAQYDYWKRLATYPCDKILIDHAIQQNEAGVLDVDSRYLREEEVAALRGFYTLQYLLFRNGQSREVNNMRPAEVDYMVAVTQALYDESVDFEASWLGTDNLPAEKVTVLQQAGINSREAYAEEFKNPGTPDSRYTSLSISLQDMFQDISGILEDEIVPGVAELLEVVEIETLDYWDSIDPVADLLNFLQSAENAYLGGLPGGREKSASDLVVTHDAALDRLIRISFAHTKYRIEVLKELEAMPQADRELAVRIAEAEAEKLVVRMGVAVPQVILDPAVEPYAAYVN